MGSIPLAAVGILAIALVIVPGQSVWSLIRGWMFGTFGIVTYLVGPLLLYLAYLIASGYLVGKFLAKTLLLATDVSPLDEILAEPLEAVVAPVPTPDPAG